ncbi:divergent PAP2 family protein [Candidatus Margulisiibacteriota bacterium]
MLSRPVVKDIGEIITLIWQNQPLVIAISALVIAQVLKGLTYYFKEKKIDFRHLVSTGGFPSSHTAMVCALATAVGLQNGWASPLFALAFVFASIVMYDAAGVRRAAGKQARILNQIMEDVLSKGHFPGEKLTELLGHTPFEVFAGFVLGIFIAYIMY